MRIEELVTNLIIFWQAGKNINVHVKLYMAKSKKLQLNAMNNQQLLHSAVSNGRMSQQYVHPTTTQLAG